MSKKYLLRFVLLAILQTAPPANGADHPVTTAIEPEQLEYYLYQAFNAPLQELRISLNHIGIEGMPSESGFLVSSVLQGYPAHDAGIVRGDLLTRLDGQAFHPIHSFNELPLSADRTSIQQRSHDLVLLRNEQTITISISPVFENLYDSYRNATLNSVQEFSSGNKIIGYVQLWALSRSSEWLASLQQLIAGLDHCDGIIVDLRGSYGFLDRQQLQLFTLNEPELALSEAPAWLQNWHKPAYAATIDSYRKPIVLLIDGSTRAAAELLALALDDAERITTLGSPTAGMLGEIILGSSSLSYRPAVNLRVNRQRLEGVGVEPEQSVAFPFSESRRDDPQFESAVSWLLGVI